MRDEQRGHSAVMLSVASSLAFGVVGALLSPMGFVYSETWPSFGIPSITGFFSHAVIGGVSLWLMVLRRQSWGQAPGALAGMGAGFISGMLGINLSLVADIYLVGLPQVGRPSLSDLPNLLAGWLSFLPAIFVAGGWQLLISTTLIGAAVGRIYQLRPRSHRSGGLSHRVPSKAARHAEAAHPTTP